MKREGRYETTQVCTFRLQRFDEAGNPESPITFELRGRNRRSARVEVDSSDQQESECNQDREEEPGRDTAYLVGELEAENLAELHDLTAGAGCSRRPWQPAMVLSISPSRTPVWPVAE
jgi:hypothetical protein